MLGALLTVTRPTVAQPILRRVQLPRRLKATLEGEAILIDPVGAILAVAMVDIVLGLAGARPIADLAGIWGYCARLIVGAVVGVEGGLDIARAQARSLEVVTGTRSRKTSSKPPEPTMKLQRAIKHGVRTTPSLSRASSQTRRRRTA